jgi:hypothetical protein
VEIRVGVIEYCPMIQSDLQPRGNSGRSDGDFGYLLSGFELLAECRRNAKLDRQPAQKRRITKNRCADAKSESGA